MPQRLWLLALLALACFAQPGCSCRKAPLPPPAPAPPAATSVAPAKAQAPAQPATVAPVAAKNGHGRLYTVNSCRVLELSGTPEEMGEAHGQLLGEEVRRVVKDVLRPDPEDDRYLKIMAGTKVMERFQPEPYRRELSALAKAAGADYMMLVALQLFGDAERGQAPAGEPAPGPADMLRTEGFPGGGGTHSDETRQRFVAVEGALFRARPPGRIGIQTCPPAAARFESCPRRPGTPPTGMPIGQQCTSFAAFGPATRDGELIAGRNFDYWYETVNGYAALVIHYRPEKGRSFVTLSWSGVINGWTLMNDAGLVAANNNGYGASESLEGISTCFLQRLVIENAATVNEALEMVKRGPRAVGTALLLAGGKPPTAVEVEFDHEAIAVRRAENGWVAAANGFRALGLEKPLGPEEDLSGRYGVLVDLIRQNHGRIDRSMNFAGARNVPIESINLHSALLFPADLTMAISMGKVPACRQPYRKLRMAAKGLESAE